MITTAVDAADLRERLSGLSPRDERRLQRRLDGARRVRKPQARSAVLAQIAADVATAEQWVARRRAAVPRLRYPEALPVVQRKDELAAAIRDHQVVVVAGETGSGKTTQLPKICLELGRGVRGMIGHTQPRRLAARSVAERIAEELGTPLGQAVGFQVRFTEQVGDDTLVKLMTDGILLAEIQGDRELRRYDTIIIDEAHERSLNIDFLLGYLRRLLPRRPDLKVIITSATIDPQRLSRHFDDAPVVEVSGRTYPVEIRYRPLVADGEDPDRDQIQAISDAVDELALEGPGDILVFLSGEREIRDTAEALARRNLRDTEILPLYARLSAAEQHRVFSPHPGRRVVLATNVAETSLTVPGIRYVIDPGTARISRYSARLKVQRLPIEPISQASAAQRAGRCGRVAAGVCIRLYAEDDFAGRPHFTDPEILRTSLASVILAMTALGLGEVADFPFLDPPDRRQVTAGVQLLEELGALSPGERDPRKRLTDVGRRLAQLPVDPRLGRMVIEAGRNGCAREVMVIAAALSIQDPRERPADQRQAADERHSRFADDDSDFLAFLNLWRHLRAQRAELSSSRFRRQCRRDFLNYLRIREWQDLEAQLRQVARGLGITPNRAPAERDAVHRSLLAGLLSHVGLRDPEKQDYLGARNARFAVWPGSALAKRPPRWLMAAELVETSRLWARTVARVDPAWVEELAQHLVKRSYSEPHWEKKRAAVMAYEKVTLYGVPLVAGRKVAFGRVDPELSRELFIRHALVEGDWDTRHRFFHDNRALLADVEQLEHRVRRRDILVDDQTLFDFYDQRIPAEVVSGRHFDSWWKKARRDRPELLDFTTALLVSDDAAEVSERDYPDEWVQGDLRLALTYQFEPGAAADGVTVHVPLPVLNRLRADDLDWQIPGLRADLVTALIRALPKAVRRSFVPAPDTARAALSRLTPRSGPLTGALEHELLRMTGVRVGPDDWDWSRVPGHLRMTIRVEDERGRALAEGKDLAALQRRLAPQLQTAMSSAAADLERTGLTGWSIGTLPRTYERTAGGQVVRGFPALVDEGATVAVRVLGSEAEQRRAMRSGTRRLLLLGVPSPLPALDKRLTNATKLALSQSPHGSLRALLDDCLACAVDALVAAYGGPAWDEAGFAALRERARAALPDAVLEVLTTVAEVLGAARALSARLAEQHPPALAAGVADVRAQLAALVFPGFVTATGRARLADLPRYLQAADQRLDKMALDPQRDRARMARVHEVVRAHAELRARARTDPRAAEVAAEVRWMVEELRVSLFAQQLGTRHPVSEQRIYRVIDSLGG